MSEIFVPATGMTGEDVVLVSWMKQPGDPVSDGDVVAVIETSKAEMEVTSESAGIMGDHLFPAGATVPPGSTIGFVAGDDDPAAPETEPEMAAAGRPDNGTTPAGPSSPESQLNGARTADSEGIGARRVDDPVSVARAPHQVSPRQRRLAALAGVSGGTTDVGRVLPTKSAAPPAIPPPPPPPPPGVRRDDHRAAISASVSRSWADIPHFSVTRELEVDVLLAALAQWRTVVSELTLTVLLVRALALTLVEPLQRSDISIGLAVATDKGVVIPVIADAARLDLFQLAKSCRAAAERARAGRMVADDAQVPAATLSNLGAIGVDHFTGIVPVGQTMLLTVGRAAPRPVVRDGRLAVASTMQTTLNLDHRSWDGYDGGLLLGRLAKVVSSPAVFATALDASPTSVRKDR